MKKQKRKVPQSALRAAVGRCEFAAGDADEAGKTDVQPLRGPIKMTAGSGIPFNHPWWGRMVFDYSGMSHGERLTLDWCHDRDQILGYADEISTNNGQLTIAGELVAANDEDRAAEILVKGQAGVPYEASIKFDPYNGLTLEEIAAGMTASVNGQDLAGPLTVVRTCLLRGVAICPYGMDPNTRSEFAQRDAGEVDVEILSTMEAQMSVQTKDPAAGNAAELQAEFAARVTDYATRFGAELGNQWCAANKPLIECYAEFAQLQATKHAAAIAELQGKLDSQTAAVTELTDRLNSLSLGEKNPLSTTPGEAAFELTAAEEAELRSSLTPGLAKFVAAQRRAKAKTAAAK